ncbi:MAG: GGDEF domain-containing protein [Spirochaetia bacterium]|nr:GGDEF domain-containing protein [Spirochaetia bacterium]
MRIYYLGGGGDEFLLLLPDCDLKQAQRIAEKIRIAIESKEIKYRKGSIPITSSFGVGNINSNVNRDDVFKQIDDALYRAKTNGRNRVETV